MLSKSVSLREANAEDSECVFAWRNAPDVRCLSINPAEIDRDSHEQWYQQKLKDPNVVFLIGEADGNPIGVLRYEINDDLATVSTYLAPGKPGQGFGSKMLEAGNQWLINYQPAIRIIEAHILQDNKASQSAFKKVGYEEELSVFRYRF